MARFSPQPLYFILEFQFFLFPPADLDIIRSGASRCLIDFLLECPVLLCEFREVSSDRHQLPPKEIADVRIVPHVAHVVQRVLGRGWDV